MREAGLSDRFCPSVSPSVSQSTIKFNKHVIQGIKRLHTWWI